MFFGIWTYFNDLQQKGFVVRTVDQHKLLYNLWLQFSQALQESLEVMIEF